MVQHPRTPQWGGTDLGEKQWQRWTWKEYWKNTETIIVDSRWENGSRKERCLSLVRSAQWCVEPAGSVASDASFAMSSLGHKLHANSYLPKKVQHIIITVARDPRFDGERNPNNAKTIQIDENLVWSSEENNYQESPLPWHTAGFRFQPI